MYRLGIDVGGTNTDAVVMQGDTVLSGVKAPTSSDVTTGVVEAMTKAMADASVDPADVTNVMIGTTHFTNAVIERKHLAPVAGVRLGLPATACLPPAVDWPEDLKYVLGNHGYLVKGGYEFDGREISPLDEVELERIAGEVRAAGLRAIAITCVFGPINADMEQRAAEIFAKACPDVPVVLSTQIGRIGLLERESAAIMNAALLDLADKTVSAFAEALGSAGLTCPFHITQNDGTLMAADVVRKFPVLTFASGPTNSMRGAAFLTGVKEAIVVDIGGTTSDVGSLQHGFPRQAATVVDIGGVRTNFRMPDVFSIGLGGGSLVKGGMDDVKVGPQSVGYKITEEAKVFGGAQLVASDIAVACGKTDMGDASKIANLDTDLAAAALAKIHDMLGSAVERSRVSPDPIPVIAVGGGSVLMPETIGDLQVILPENFAVANAVGAAIAQISGEVDRVFSLDGTSRDACIAEAEAEATKLAIAAGAVTETIQTIEKEDIPLAYLPGNATRIHVKVVGEMGGVTHD